tara:strand:+ start:134 stop:844 length:711 start_codon:yes stop_codon:yes gene_type:complete
MKDLLQKLTDLEATLDSMDSPKEVKQINEAANMSINMSGENADEVARLVDIMRGGGAPDPKPMAPDMMPMDKMRDLVKMGPPPGMDDMPKGDDDKDKDAIMGMDMGMEDDVEEAGYDNSPEEDYKDHKYMTRDLSGGINREKQAYAKAQDGDNAMAVEELQAALKDALINKMAEGKDEFKKTGKDGDGSFDESGCVGEMKKLKASGCAKHEMYDKVAEKYGCGKSQFEKLFAAHCA